MAVSETKTLGGKNSPRKSQNRRRFRQFAQVKQHQCDRNKGTSGEAGDLDKAAVLNTLGFVLIIVRTHFGRLTQELCGGAFGGAVNGLVRPMRMLSSSLCLIYA